MKRKKSSGKSGRTEADIDVNEPYVPPVSRLSQYFQHLRCTSISLIVAVQFKKSRHIL